MIADCDLEAVLLVGRLNVLLVAVLLYFNPGTVDCSVTIRSVPTVSMP